MLLMPKTAVEDSVASDVGFYVAVVVLAFAAGWLLCDWSYRRQLFHIRKLLKVYRRELGYVPHDLLSLSSKELDQMQSEYPEG